MKIELNNLSYSYKNVCALSDINLIIEKGNLVTILGPNGSGKSTLLKCIVSILKTKENSIIINNKSISEYNTSDLSKIIAYIPQNEVAVDELNVFDTILIGRKPYINRCTKDSDLKEVNKVITELQLNDIAFRQMNNLSGGQRQRVYIARALVQNPKILLLDEPTANLDIYHQLKVMDLLLKLTEQGITVIITEHDINMAARYATKVIMLREGKLFDCGDSNVFSEENIKNLYDIHASIHCLDNHIYVVPEKTVK